MRHEQSPAKWLKKDQTFGRDFTLNLTLAGQLCTKCISTWHVHVFIVSYMQSKNNDDNNNRAQKAKSCKKKAKLQMVKASVGTRPHTCTPLYSQKISFCSLKKEKQITYIIAEKSTAWTERESSYFHPYSSVPLWLLWCFILSLLPSVPTRQTPARKNLPYWFILLKNEIKQNKINHRSPLIDRQN